MSKNYVFDTLGGCLKGRRGKECASVGSDKAIRAASFPKRNISPFGLSHPLPYARMAALFDFPNEKIFSFPIEDFRPIAQMSGAAPDRGMLDAWRAEGNNADCCAVLPKNDGARIALSVDTVRGARRRKQKALHARANRIFHNSKGKNRKFTVSFLALYCFCGLRTFLTGCGSLLPSGKREPFLRLFGSPSTPGSRHRSSSYPAACRPAAAP